MLGTQWYLDRPTFPLTGTVADLQVEMVGRPDSLAGGPGSCGSPASTARRMGQRFAPGRAAGRARPPSRLQFLRAQRQHRVRACGASRHTRCRPSACTRTITSLPTRWSGSTSITWRRPLTSCSAPPASWPTARRAALEPGGRPSAAPLTDDRPRPRLDPQARGRGMVERQRPPAGRVAGLLHPLRAGADPDRGHRHRRRLLRRRGGAAGGDAARSRGWSAKRGAGGAGHAGGRLAAVRQRGRDGHRADHLLPRRDRRVPRAADRAQRHLAGEAQARRRASRTCCSSGCSRSAW